MYSRALRNVLNLSSKLKDQKNSIGFSSFALTTQKLLNSTSYYCCQKHYSDDGYKKLLEYSPDPKERKMKIEQIAQGKIDKILEERPDAERLMKILDLEISLMREEGERVPSQLRPRDWAELLELRSSHQRKKFLEYLFITEKRREQQKQEKEERSLDLERHRQERDNAPEADGIVYGVGKNSLMRRIMEPTMNKLWSWNCIKAIMFGNKLVFDCSYEPFMNNMETKSCAKQLMEAYSLNRHHNYPFEIFLCNADLEGPLIEKLFRFIPTMFDDSFPMTITPKSYLDIFEKSKLVYLTANAEATLETYDPESVYIVGAYVDKGSKQPVSLAKAKKEGLRMAKLPLDRYLQFGDGSGKNLTVNQVCGIMLDIQNGNWQTALEHVPKRKLYESRLYALEKRVQMQARQFQQNTGNILNTEEEKPRFEQNSENRMNSRGRKPGLDLNRENTWKNQEFKSKLFESKEVNDFSHAARAKLRERFNK